MEAFIGHFQYIFLIIILGVSAIIDYRIQKIPNLITFPAMLVSVIYHTSNNGVSGLTFSLLGLGTGIAVFILPYIMGGMGAGDAKLMGAVGAMLGVKGAFAAFIYVALAGGFYAVVIFLLNLDYFKKALPDYIETFKSFILTKKLYFEPISLNKKKPRLCYGVAIAVGTYIYLGMKFFGMQSLF